jgi:hypothetical protein
MPNRNSNTLNGLFLLEQLVLDGGRYIPSTSASIHLILSKFKVAPTAAQDLQLFLGTKLFEIR